MVNLPPSAATKQRKTQIDPLLLVPFQCKVEGTDILFTRTLKHLSEETARIYSNEFKNSEISLPSLNGPKKLRQSFWWNSLPPPQESRMHLKEQRTLDDKLDRLISLHFPEYQADQIYLALSQTRQDQFETI